jgi:hypothetical protein
MANTFRLYGPAIGEPTAVVDADVTGVSLDGSIELTPQDGNLSKFTLDPSKLRSLADENKAYDMATVDTNDPIWKAIEDVENRFKNADDDREAFVAAAETLFRGAR